MHPIAKISLLYFGVVLSAGLFCIPKHRHLSFVGVSVIFAYLNFGYGPWEEQVRKSVSVAVGIYDPPFNFFGLTKDFSELYVMTPCPNETQCSILGDYFTFHPAWAVKFLERHLLGEGASSRRWKLVGHIWPNTLGMLLCLVQLCKPLRDGYPKLHRWNGRFIATLMTFGTIKALELAREEPHLVAYGGFSGTLGWYWMSAIMLGCLYCGLLSAIRGNFVEHEKWMKRFYGAMFGAFFLFRLLFLFVLGPFMRWSSSFNFQMTMWCATPLGVVLADLLFVDKQKASYKKQL